MYDDIERDRTLSVNKGVYVFKFVSVLVDNLLVFLSSQPQKNHINSQQKAKEFLQNEEEII